MFTIMVYLKRNFIEVEMDTKTKKITQNWKNQGYYTEGDDDIEGKYNHSADGKDSLKNNRINDF